MSFVLSIISGILSALPFINFSLFPIIWISIVPFLIVLYRAKNEKESILYGFIFGIFFFGINLYWVTELSQYVSFWAYLAWAVLIFGQSIFIVVFSFILYRFVISRRKEYSRAWRKVFWIFAPSVIWVSLEWIRSLGPYGVTGGGLGYSQAFFIPLIQIASVTGVYGISFLIVFFNSVLTFLFIEKGSIVERFKKQLIAVLILAFLAIVVFSYGRAKIAEHKYEKREGLVVAIIQANVPQKEKLRYSQTYRIFNEHLGLSDEVVKYSPDVIIWPETAVTDYLLENAGMLSKLRDFIDKNRCYLIVGAPYFSADSKIFNSLIVFSPQGEASGRYDKRHLVPFGEYLPLRSLFYPILRHTGNLFEEDYDSNPISKLLTIKGYVAAANICFESTFPYIVRSRVKRGGDFILVATNDAWFGNSPAAKQHFYSGVFRAIENGSYLVQVANTGISGDIDPLGRVIKRTKLGIRETLIVSVPKKGKGTFYLKYGDLFVYLCLLGTILLTVWKKFPWLKEISQ